MLLTHENAEDLSGKALYEHAFHSPRPPRRRGSLGVIMKRRGFLQALLGIPAAALIPKISFPQKVIAEPAAKAITTGFGLADVKRSGGIITTGNHPKLLWPGVKAYWDEQYKNAPDLFEKE